MKTSELIKILSANGCYFLSHGGRHDRWFSPITGKTFPVPRHGSQEIPKGTERSIRKRAGIE
ncbi:MAG: type II toxin-antitoxin system HicA family toxin [Prevotellaceae bacterium]|nr:type II toxin-antitoxin system HicA family toxin [Prevotellaceae bacterium]